VFYSLIFQLVNIGIKRREYFHVSNFWNFFDLLFIILILCAESMHIENVVRDPYEGLLCKDIVLQITDNIKLATK